MNRIAVLALVGGLCAVSSAQQDFDIDRIVVTQEDARYVSPPRLLVEGDVQRYWISPSGNAVLSNRVAAPQLLPSWGEMNEQDLLSRLKRPGTKLFTRGYQVANRES